jgi:hypothetical protein
MKAEVYVNQDKSLSDLQTLIKHSFLLYFPRELLMNFLKLYINACFAWWISHFICDYILELSCEATIYLKTDKAYYKINPKVTMIVLYSYSLTGLNKCSTPGYYKYFLWNCSTEI